MNELIQMMLDCDGKVTFKNNAKTSIDLLKAFEPMALELDPEGYYLCYSGGKDSDTILNIAIEAGVKFSANYNITGIDPKECIVHIKATREKLALMGIRLHMHSPDFFTTGIYKGLLKNMWRLIVHKGIPPTKLLRYCCSELKEKGGKGKLCLTGVRWAESTARKSRRPLEIVTSRKVDKKLFNDNETDRRQFENCTQKGKKVINPVIDWKDSDIWDYLRDNNSPYCCLYDQGAERIGCIGCPQASTDKRNKEFKENPYIRELYLKAFDEMIRQRKIKGLGVDANWKDGIHVMNWWINATDQEQQEVMEGQCDIEDLESEV